MEEAKVAEFIGNKSMEEASYCFYWNKLKSLYTKR
jgi:hypothetical protein